MIYIATRTSSSIIGRLYLVVVFGFFDIQQPPGRLFGIGSLANTNEVTTKGVCRVGVFSGHVESIANAVQYASLKGRLRAAASVVAIAVAVGVTITVGVTIGGTAILLLLLCPHGLQLQLLWLLTNVSQRRRDDRRVVRTANVHVWVLGLLLEKINQILFQF